MAPMLPNMQVNVFYSSETVTGRRKNSSESNKSEDQGVMKGEGEPLRTDETVTMEVLNMGETHVRNKN